MGGVGSLNIAAWAVGAGFCVNRMAWPSKGSTVFFGHSRPTNNAAELAALHAALQALSFPSCTQVSHLHVFGDSDLVLHFLRREAVAKRPHLARVV